MYAYVTLSYSQKMKISSYLIAGLYSDGIDVTGTEHSLGQLVITIIWDDNRCHTTLHYHQYNKSQLGYNRNSHQDRAIDAEVVSGCESVETLVNRVEDLRTRVSYANSGRIGAFKPTYSFTSMKNINFEKI